MGAPVKKQRILLRLVLIHILQSFFNQTNAENDARETPLSTWNNEPQENLYNLEHDIAGNNTEADKSVIIEITGNRTNLIFDWKVDEILAYSRLIQSGRIDDAHKLKAKFFSTPTHYPEENLNLFSDWYLPIYEQYGGSNTIQKFLQVVQFYYSKRHGSFDIPNEILPGECVHMWNQAANMDLRDLAHKAFGWIPDYRKQFDVARQKHSLYKYADVYPNASWYEPPERWTEDWDDHRSNVTLVYSDEHTAFYYDTTIPYNLTWPFKLVSKAWAYSKRAFELAPPDPRFYVILHNGGNSLEYSYSKQFSYVNHAYANRLVWDCTGATDDPWVDTFSVRDQTFVIEEGVAPTLVQIAKETGNSPVIDLQPEIVGIFAYDIYVGIGALNDADRYKSDSQRKESGSMGKNIFWFRDWYYPIYRQYGKTVVLDKFLTLLHDYWPRKGADFTKQMEMGEFVHFWSGAAGVDLTDLAMKAFGMSPADLALFKQAKLQYPKLNYTCYGTCHNNLDNATRADHSTGSLVTGLSAGFASVLVGVVIICLYVYRKKVNELKAQIRELTNDEIEEFYDGNSNLVDGDGNALVESQPFNKEYELSPEQIEIYFDQVLGSGEFGLVLRGLLKAPSGKCEFDTVVAVKTVKPNVDVECFKALLTELKVMCYLGSHPNIASLLGALTVNIRKREVYIAVEFCAQGDLQKFLKNNRNNFTHLFPRTSSLSTEYTNIGTTSADPCQKVDDKFTLNYVMEEIDVSTERSEELCCRFSTINLLEWASQVAEGMAYIASKNVIHGDLAARNVLLTASNVAKISDFGLSRQLLNYANYLKTSKTPMPWRWMAIESLRDMNFSVKSDTWAFGVTLYEIFSLGTTPYPGWTWDYEFIDKLVAGQRLSEPEFGSQEIYKIMMDCMKSNPEERATFTDLIHRLEAIKSGLLGADVPSYVNISKNVQ